MLAGTRITRLGSAALVAGSVALAGAGCGITKGTFHGGTTAIGAHRTVLVNGRRAVNYGTENDRGVKHTTLGIFPGHFAPTILIGNPGQSLTLTLQSNDVKSHVLVVPSQHIRARVGGDQTKTIHVRFPRSGTALFYDRADRDRGMRGGLRAHR
jgi:hypothetical protein